GVPWWRWLLTGGFLGAGHCLRRLCRVGKKFLDRACGLADALLIFDERNADEAFAMLPKADARRNCHVSLLDQELGERDGTEMTKALWHRRPSKHRRGRRWDGKARPPKAFDERVAAALIHGADLVDALLRTVQGRRGRHLNRCEGAVIEIRFDARQGADQPFVADCEAHAPAGHVVRF